MTVLTVAHRTIYRYTNPITFSEHWMMMIRPRDSHDLRLLDTEPILRLAGRGAPSQPDRSATRPLREVGLALAASRRQT
jgi:hypothetical protein